MDYTTSTPNFEAIIPGQRWAATQQSHLGWEVNVLRVSGQHVETEVLAPPQERGRRTQYSLDMFPHNFRLLSNPKTIVPPLSTQVPTHQVCTTCNIDKPIADYTQIVVNKGTNKGKPSGKYFKMCKQCTTAAKTAGIRAAHAQRKAQRTTTPASLNLAPITIAQPYVPPTPVVNVPPIAQPTTLSTQLLQLATQVEALEHTATTNSKYTALLSAARDIVVEAEASFGVIVIRQSTFTKLEHAVQALKDTNNHA